MRLLYIIYQICIGLPLFLEFLGLLPWSSVVGVYVPSVFVAHQRNRPREYRQGYFVCVCGESSGFVRHILDLRFLAS